MFKTALLMSVAATLTLAASATAEPPAVETPKVLAGDYVDTTSVESIVNDLFKSDRVKGLTDEQKVIGFYHWYRRVVYPYRYMASDRRDVLKSINTAGFNLCGSQAAVVRQILVAAGYSCRITNVSAGKEWGHTVWEVKYDDKWHLFDAMTAFYVMTRDNPPHVASGDEIEADPTLVTKAVEEKRCGPEYVYTARDHEITMAKREEFTKANHKEDVAWSLLTTEPGSIVDFWNAAATKKKISPTSPDNDGGGHATPNVLDIRLKANERYVRMWHGAGLWMKPPSFPNTPPQNMAAGDNEKFDTVNFKYFEPYRHVDPKNPWNVAVYRSYGNGYLEWTPANAEQLAQGAKLENLHQMAENKSRGFPMLEIEAGAKGGTLILPVKSPYAVVQIELEIAGSAAVWLAPISNGKRGIAKKLWSAADAAADGPNAPKATKAGDVTTVTIPLVDHPSPLYEYDLRLTVAESTLGLKRMKTTFQCNPMALPGLVPGGNKIRVSAAQPGKIAGGKLVVTYNWFDAPEWKEAKSNVKELTELPGEYTIDLPAGEKLPKMESLELFLKAE